MPKIIRIFLIFFSLKNIILGAHFSFLLKMQNRTNKKSGKYYFTLLLCFCKVVDILGWYSVHCHPKIVGEQQTLPSKNFHYHPKSYFDDSKVLKMNRILNFQQECYYFEELMGVVVFTKVLGHAKSQSPRQCSMARSRSQTTLTRFWFFLPPTPLR